MTLISKRSKTPGLAAGSWQPWFTPRVSARNGATFPSVLNGPLLIPYLFWCPQSRFARCALCPWRDVTAVYSVFNLTRYPSLYWSYLRLQCLGWRQTFLWLPTSPHGVAVHKTNMKVSRRWGPHVASAVCASWLCCVWPAEWRTVVDWPVDRYLPHTDSVCVCLGFCC
jgi:hypothetical protein